LNQKNRLAAVSPKSDQAFGSGGDARQQLQARLSRTKNPGGGAGVSLMSGAISASVTLIAELVGRTNSQI